MKLRFNPQALAVVIILAAVGFAANPDSRVAAPADPVLEMQAVPSDPAPVPATLPAPDSTLNDATNVDSATSHDPDASAAAPLEVLTGSASYYANSLAGRRTASGERYDPRQLVAAHRTLPFGTVLRVTNSTNDRSVEVRVVDRGPFARGRVLDLSRRAAEQIGMIRNGHASVRIEVLSYGG